MEQWEIDARLDAEIDSSMSRFLKQIEKEHEEKEKKQNIDYLIKDKYGIDDFYGWESK